MVQCSWKTSDSKESIRNNHSGKTKQTIYMVLPDNKYVSEKDYDGYGVFGSRNYFEEVERFNEPFAKAITNPNDNADKGVELDEWGRAHLKEYSQVSYIVDDAYKKYIKKTKSKISKQGFIKMGKGIKLPKFVKYIKDDNGQTKKWEDIDISDVCEYNGDEKCDDE